MGNALTSEDDNEFLNLDKSSWCASDSSCDYSRSHPSEEETPPLLRHSPSCLGAALVPPGQGRLFIDPDARRLLSRLPVERAQGCAALAGRGPEAAPFASKLTELILDVDSGVRAAAEESLATLMDEGVAVFSSPDEVAAVYARGLVSKSSDVRKATCKILGDSASYTAAYADALFEVMIGDDDAVVSDEAFRTLIKFRRAGISTRLLMRQVPGGGGAAEERDIAPSSSKSIFERSRRPARPLKVGDTQESLTDAMRYNTLLQHSGRPITPGHASYSVPIQTLRI